jgi:8-oxo-dGTP diphosphatase
MTAFPRVGVGVILKDTQGRILLGERLNSHGAHTWGPPGGHLEFGETLEHCAIREVLEEVGGTITSPQLLGFSETVFEGEGKHYVSFFYSASWNDGQPIRLCEPEKVLSWRWFDPKNLPQNLFLTFKDFLQTQNLKL